MAAKGLKRVTPAHSGAFASVRRQARVARGNRPTLAVLNGVHPSLRARVSEIAPLGRSEQVRRSHTTPVIALMRHNHAVLKGAVGQFVGDAVRFQGRLASPPGGHLSVAVRPHRSHPQPALAACIDLGPKTFSQGGQNMLSHHPPGYTTEALLG